ncbi:MAG: D-amino acid aminotransferase [Gemmatimonadetes bacterium]|nr:D-amino acid aminotransferase [Gemmatimonadota bacterium]MDA1103079.1 D-amino acid aminotransferase [Gemmatimonadota bacterium]
MTTVFLNGAFIPKSEAMISVDDRGFLLGDGLYEVTPFYGGVPFGLDRHLARLARGLEWIRIAYDVESLEAMHRELLTRNGLENAERSMVYMQITRGAAPRTHYFPEGDVTPTIFASAKAWSRPTDEVWNRGFRAITVPDRRWSRVDVKTICLLPNAMAFQAARDVGADDAILVRDGVAIEGAHQNFWGVFGGTAVTHPKTGHILPGITRGVVLEEAHAAGVPVEERPIQVEELIDAEELFFTGTTGEVRPVVEVDGRAVGDGRVGPVTRRLSDLLLARIEATRDAAKAG